MKQCYWIWYPGDFELYYAMKQNFSRVERGYGWPAFWKSEGFRNRVVFRRTYRLELGYYEEIMQQIKAYWGGMLKCGAVTFWEEYNPQTPQEEQYDMYGDKFGKSLCHAWSASPIYLIAKYFVGLTVIEPVQGKYELHFYKDAFKFLDCTLPVGDKNVHLNWDGNTMIETQEE